MSSCHIGPWTPLYDQVTLTMSPFFKVSNGQVHQAWMGRPILSSESVIKGDESLVMQDF